MDRFIIFNGENIYEEDLLKTNLFSMIGLGKFMDCVIGNGVSLNRLGCVPNTPADLTVIVQPGEIYELENIDNTSYGSLPADTTHQIVKQGILLNSVQLNCPAPPTPGNSINYLVEFNYADSDTQTENRTFYQAAPQVVPTVRQGICQVQILAGTPAPTGTQTTPTPTTGYTGAYVVTVANGQTAINSGNITVYSGAPFITEKLQNKISQAFADLRYGQITTIQSGGYMYAVDTGAANAYVASLSPAITSLTTGMVIRLVIAHANTGASTLNLNGLGVKNITLQGGVALIAGELPPVAELYYDGTEWILLNRANIAFVSSVTYTASQSIPNTNTATLVNFDTVEFDTFSIWSGINFRFTPGRLGYYRLSANLFATTPPAGTYYMNVFQNGVLARRLNEHATSGNDVTLSGSTILKATNLTDYFDLRATNDTAAAFNVGVGLSDFQIEFIGT